MEMYLVRSVHSCRFTRKAHIMQGSYQSPMSLTIGPISYSVRMLII